MSAVKGGLSGADKEEEVLQMRTPALFGVKKIRIFRYLWGVRTNKGRASADILQKSLIDSLLINNNF